MYSAFSNQNSHKQNFGLLNSTLNNSSFEEFYVPFGRLTNMSTRRGQVEFLSDLVDEAKQVALEAMEVSKSKY